MQTISPLLSRVSQKFRPFYLLRARAFYWPDCATPSPPPSTRMSTVTPKIGTAIIVCAPPMQKARYSSYSSRVELSCRRLSNFSLVCRQDRSGAKQKSIGHNFITFIIVPHRCGAQERHTPNGQILSGHGSHARETERNFSSEFSAALKVTGRRRRSRGSSQRRKMIVT